MSLEVAILLTMNLLNRFLFSGGIATSVHWLVLWQLVYLKVEPVIANTIGAFVGALVNYCLQYYVTFKSKKSHRKALRDYGIVVFVSWFATTAVFWFLFERLMLSIIVTQMLTVTIVSTLNFFLYRYKVFNEQKLQ